jgi:hypothetical protein
MLHEELQEAELLGGQLDFLPADPDEVRVRIQRHLAHPQDLRCPAVDAALEGADPREELGHGERLDEVVVSSGIEAKDPVVKAIPRRQHDDRGEPSGLSQGVAYGDAIDLRKQQVEEDQLVVLGQGGMLPALSIVNDLDGMKLLRQGTPQDVRELAVIFHAEDSHGQASPFSPDVPPWSS